MGNLLINNNWLCSLDGDIFIPEIKNIYHDTLCNNKIYCIKATDFRDRSFYVALYKTKNEAVRACKYLKNIL